MDFSVTMVRIHFIVLLWFSKQLPQIHYLNGITFTCRLFERLEEVIVTFSQCLKCQNNRHYRQLWSAAQILFYIYGNASIFCYARCGSFIYDAVLFFSTLVINCIFLKDFKVPCRIYTIEQLDWKIFHNKPSLMSLHALRKGYRDMNSLKSYCDTVARCWGWSLLQENGFHIFLYFTGE